MSAVCYLLPLLSLTCNCHCYALYVPRPVPCSPYRCSAGEASALRAAPGRLYEVLQSINSKTRNRLRKRRSLLCFDEQINALQNYLSTVDYS